MQSVNLIELFAIILFPATSYGLNNPKTRHSIRPTCHNDVTSRASTESRALQAPRCLSASPSSPPSGHLNCQDLLSVGRLQPPEPTENRHLATS
jgi:hypothetical protein